ncbi:MAG TPA: ATP-binding protein [candidate division WOR-3 bacterium]|uniref:ATP-binding protein n=1 Tax=candidate division WOR-3 bacterium TaxID=2052148 RepID=A0A7V0T5C4_UNCW3|nr:ATP-binding protein [candidate division WOR-3 bacterium]
MEREVVELLLVFATDLTNDRSRGLAVEEIVELLALGRREDAQRLLPYFLPGSRLREMGADGISGFVGPRRLRLDDDLVASLLGVEPGRKPTEAKSEPTCRCADITGFLADAGVVLDPAALDALRTVWSHIRCRDVIREQWGFGGPGRASGGVCLLFHGPPGTGKTLTAETLARALGREPLVINYPDLVSKWVGETQKHTRAAFVEAGRTGKVLVFDEADAIFARRTQVNTAADRFANSEVNTLLMEMERFAGTVILTTNHAGVLDPALERRIRHKVYFGPPDAGTRAGIWRKHLPEQAPLAEDVDLDRLAQEYRLTGGQIANAVMTAAALAAARLDDGSEKTRITMADFEAGAKREARGYDAVTNGSKLGF